MALPDVLDQLQQPQSLSILTLAEPILTPAHQDNGHTVSTPSSLSADLSHYQELFSKLRFSYVEQVTKERFLRAVTSDPPDFVSASENAELEEQLKQDKAALKEKKQEVREIISALEEQGRHLAHRYDEVQLRTTQLENLPSEIEKLQDAIGVLKQQQEPEVDDPEMRMPLQQTKDLLRERRQELQNVDLEIERLQAALPAKRAEVQRLQDELEPIQVRKAKAVEEAQEAKRRRDNDEYSDELEDKIRWLRGVQNTLQTMLEE